MRKEYDFSNSFPNKYAKKFAEGTNVVVLDPDLADYFPDSESVNAVLRAVVSILPLIREKEKTSESEVSE